MPGLTLGKKEKKQRSIAQAFLNDLFQEIPIPSTFVSSSSYSNDVHQLIVNAKEALPIDSKIRKALERNIDWSCQYLQTKIKEHIKDSSTNENEIQFDDNCGSKTFYQQNSIHKHDHPIFSCWPEINETNSISDTSRFINSLSVHNKNNQRKTTLESIVMALRCLSTSYTPISQHILSNYAYLICTNLMETNDSDNDTKRKYKVVLDYISNHIMLLCMSGGNDSSTTTMTNSNTNQIDPIYCVIVWLLYLYPYNSAIGFEKLKKKEETKQQKQEKNIIALLISFLTSLSSISTSLSSSSSSSSLVNSNISTDVSAYIILACSQHPKFPIATKSTSSPSSIATLEFLYQMLTNVLQYSNMAQKNALPSIVLVPDVQKRWKLLTKWANNTVGYPQLDTRISFHAEKIIKFDTNGDHEKENNDEKNDQDNKSMEKGEELMKIETNDESVEKQEFTETEPLSNLKSDTNENEQNDKSMDTVPIESYNDIVLERKNNIDNNAEEKDKMKENDKMEEKKKTIKDDTEEDKEEANQEAKKDDIKQDQNKETKDYDVKKPQLITTKPSSNFKNDISEKDEEKVNDMPDQKDEAILPEKQKEAKDVKVTDEEQKVPKKSKKKARTARKSSRTATKDEVSTENSPVEDIQVHGTIRRIGVHTIPNDESKEDDKKIDPPPPTKKKTVRRKTKKNMLPKISEISESAPPIDIIITDSKNNPKITSTNLNDNEVSSPEKSARRSTRRKRASSNPENNDNASATSNSSTSTLRRSTRKRKAVKRDF